jgi:tRNA threonylcarbamoyl adenosine modification protein (Sua5/YciO/YrdC/YwlC family)
VTSIEDAVAELRRGGVVVVPTDTVYGLAADPSLPEAIRALFELKGRPEHKAVAVLGAEAEGLQTVARFDASATRLARAFWPGPLTLVLPRASGFEHDVGGTNDGTIGVRVPASGVMRTLLREAGPLAVTSANVSGDPAANSVAEARRIFGDRVSAYVDDGPGAGRPSTVVSLVGGPRLLREGALTEAEVMGVLDS